MVTEATGDAQIVGIENLHQPRGLERIRIDNTAVILGMFPAKQPGNLRQEVVDSGGLEPAGEPGPATDIAIIARRPGEIGDPAMAEAEEMLGDECPAGPCGPSGPCGPVAPVAPPLAPTVF